MNAFGWRQRFLAQAAHRDDLDVDAIHALVRMAIPAVDLDEALTVLDEARSLHLAAESIAAQDLINGLIDQQHAAEEGGESDPLVQGR